MFETIFLEYIPKSRKAVSGDGCFMAFDKCCQLAFPKDWTSLQCHQPRTTVAVSPCPQQHWVLYAFYIYIYMYIYLIY